MHEIHEECGVFGVYTQERADVASLAYYALYALQHRGQESCGIAVNNDGVIDCYKDVGLVNEVFTRDVLEKLHEGSMAVGHCRYGTTGTQSRGNAQPLLVNHLKGALALCHNGNLVNARELREELPGVELVFIVGADAALTLPRWHESAELGRLAMFAAATRPGFELGEEALRVLRERRFDVRPFVVPGIDISSSELRQRVAEGRTIRYLVPEAVREIIEEEQLYRKEADHGRLA